MTFSVDASASGDLCSRVINVIVQTREVLGMEGVLGVDEILSCRPLLDQLRKLATIRQIESSGIEALQSFSRIWDPRMASFARDPNAAPFSRFETATMLEALGAYARWLNHNFPPKPPMFPN